MALDSRPRLVLWDIDHTLLESRGIGHDVYERVFPAVTGEPLRELSLVQGSTELDIIHNTLRLHRLDCTQGSVTRLAAALADGYREAVDELTTRGRVLPGAWRALADLAADPGTWQSVLTGNTTEVARIKVEAFGLDRYLDLSIGAYGDDHRDRAELVGIARARAGRQLGSEVPADRVVLIGDTPNDVAAALVAGARIVGVATGKYSADALRAAGAPVVVASLTDLPALRGVLG
ncbi:haloacid dehalogenase-like hydrolase [Saccharopolyspora sp. HNM0983]|uniref:Haloacid dehalogenase-like hydrolase n=1 Tax=Saccharopolyspora montiporae TaxID=2781240 RepID=A0A929B4E7_9PSEU|nr:haloacid dehalogenase-like hydrolase [Saccharopolyspora sp. HNM0983]MBE9372974.1 haloacid dehalogenase-like hydrolase [Saccharopolyspora sp. HNM0983]